MATSPHQPVVISWSHWRIPRLLRWVYWLLTVASLFIASSLGAANQHAARTRRGAASVPVGSTRKALTIWVCPKFLCLSGIWSLSVAMMMYDFIFQSNYREVRITLQTSSDLVFEKDFGTPKWPLATPKWRPAGARFLKHRPWIGQ